MKHGITSLADYNKDFSEKALDMFPDSSFKQLIKLKIARDVGRQK